MPMMWNEWRDPIFDSSILRVFVLAVGACSVRAGRRRVQRGATAASLRPDNLVKCHLVKNQNKVGARTAKAAAESAEPVSELTTNRLSVYLRCLNSLDAAGVRTVSSQALAEQFHLNAAQIRKDLAHFGEFGVRGVGYYVKELRRHLRQILGVDGRVAIAILGAGNLGMALADYPGFREEGFEIAALFDTMREKIGRRSRAGVPIFDTREFRRLVRRAKIRIAVIAVPADAAQSVVNTVVAAGVKAILNFSPGTLNVPSDVKLKSVDLTVSLESLSFFLAQGDLDG
jgi:redox-sensing transcriptional repressor